MQFLNTIRHLAAFDTWALPQVHCGVLVIGSGVAGLRAALEAAEHTRVVIVTKRAPDLSNTAEAQGGIAAAVSPDDSIGKHIEDTLAAGHGLCDEAVVASVVNEGPLRIEELARWGARFDRKGEAFVLGREGGHSAARIVQAQGDATGQEIVRVLLQAVRVHPDIQLVDRAFVVDLLTDEQRCVGAVVHDERWGMMTVWARATVLASGGAGQLYRETTNPEVATADGLAMAFRAGAELRDLEFIQFHPTTLYVAGAARALVSETLRGYGAVLRNAQGEAFMARYHPAGDLAPRDAVSRAIYEEMRRTQAPNVFLDFRHLDAARVLDRFPTLRRLCADFDLDIRRDLLPIRPSAHYCMGGVAVDPSGASSVAGLYACGEVACTGLHGANRLGSNSLLEGLVYGARAGAKAASEAADRADLRAPRLRNVVEHAHRRPIDIADVRNSLRSLMGRAVGIERDGPALRQAEESIDFWCRYVMPTEFASPAGWELQNMLTVAKLIAQAAFRREESRGAHYRTDFPETDDARWRVHLAVSREAGFFTRPLSSRGV